MYTEIELILSDETEDQETGVITSSTKKIKVPAVKQSVSRKARDVYAEKAMKGAIRFKIQFLGNLDLSTCQSFIYTGKKYAVTDYTQDVTGTSFFIEGATVRSPE